MENIKQFAPTWFLDFGCLLFGLFVDSMTGNSIMPIRRRLFKKMMRQSDDEYYTAAHKEPAREPSMY